jgi:hypothetical protein
MKTNEELEQEYQDMLKYYADKPFTELVQEIVSLKNMVEPLQEHNKWLQKQILKIREIVQPLDFLPRNEDGEVVKPRRGRPRKDDKFKSMKSLFNDIKEV